MWFRRFLVLLVSFVLAVVPALPAFAIANPNSVSITRTHATQNVLVTGDMLIMAEYDIEYAVIPSELINQSFIFRLIDTDNSTEIGRVLAYPFVFSGYGQGVISFYFPVSPGTDPFTIRVEGNPAVFSTPFSQDFILQATTYTPLAADPDADIKAQVLTYCTDLNPSFNSVLGTFLDGTDGTTTTLTANGELYFTNAIQNLRVMSPSLFQIQQVAPTASVDTYTGAQATAYKNRFVGTWVGSSSAAFANLLNVDAQLAMGFIIVILCLGWAAIAVKLLDQILYALPLMLVQMFAGVLLGWVSMAVMSVIIFLLGLYLGIIIVMKAVNA